MIHGASGRVGLIIVSLTLSLTVAGLVATPSPAYAGKLKRVRNTVRGNSSKSKSRYAGKLKRVRNVVRGNSLKSSSRSESKSRSSQSSRGHHHNSSYGHSSRSSINDSLLAIPLLTAPWWLPRLAMGDNSRRRFAYLPYPYAAQHPGFILVEGDDAPTGSVGGRPILGEGMSLRAGIEGGWVDASLMRTSLSARLSGRYRFELETRWDLFSEFSGGGGIEQIWLGDVNLTWQHAVGRHGQFRAGLGLRTMVDVEGARYGINFTYGFDLYPSDPMVLHAEVDAGSVGLAAFMQLRASVGVMIGPMELYAGYDQTWVDGIDLGGPLVGLRLWR